MSRRQQRTVEEIPGSGVLESNGKQVQVSYFDPFGLHAIFDHSDLTLRLEDGRRFACSLSRVDNGGGRIVARARTGGALYRE